MELSSTEINNFRQKLLTWASQVERPMPWKGITDPYKIWLSEIILQQTRVAQGWDYYERMISRFPDVQSLAEAPLTELIIQWQGLGYYSRARNLHKCAEIIWTVHQGKFPNNYEALLKLPGIGPYTAAAIASFAFAESRAVVDGNVIRVLARVFGIQKYPASSNERKQFELLAQTLIDPLNPAKYNQAIMDFGAVLCNPIKPFCSICPFEFICVAKSLDQVALYPSKQIKAAKIERHFQFLLIQDKDNWYMKRREAADIWKDLYQPLSIESSMQQPHSETIELLPEPERILVKRLYSKSFQTFGPYTQLLTHQKINAYFYLFEAIAPQMIEIDLIKIPKSLIPQTPMPRIIKKFFEENISLMRN
ncbi:MAG: A/G-specific adenine glycosylase [Saprospiraceae bacterium]